MGELRFNVLVRRQGDSVFSSDKFATEEYSDIEDLKDAICHFIDVHVEEEEEYSYRNPIEEAEDEAI